MHEAEESMAVAAEVPEDLPRGGTRTSTRSTRASAW
jgi:hypothetical protein